MIAALAPLVAFGSMLFYVEIIHWELFPTSLLNVAEAYANPCRANRKQIEMAKTQWAADENKTVGDMPTDTDLFGADRYFRVKPSCPGGGTYTVGRVGEPTRCSLKQHVDQP